MLDIYPCVDVEYPIFTKEEVWLMRETVMDYFGSAQEAQDLPLLNLWELYQLIKEEG